MSSGFVCPPAPSREIIMHKRIMHMIGDIIPVTPTRRPKEINSLPERKTKKRMVNYVGRVLHFFEDDMCPKTPERRPEEINSLPERKTKKRMVNYVGRVIDFESDTAGICINRPPVIERVPRSLLDMLTAFGFESN